MCMGRRESVKIELRSVHLCGVFKDVVCVTKCARPGIFAALRAARMMTASMSRVKIARCVLDDTERG